MTSNTSDKYRAPALEKGLAIIEYLALQAVAQSQSEIASGLNRNPNEIYRMLAALEAHGYIRRDPVSSKYSLTLKLYYLSHRHSFIDKLRSASLQAMKDTSAAIHESCHLCVLYDHQMMVIAYSKSPSPIAVTIAAGNLYAVAQTASGKLLLSFTEAETRQRILEQDSFYTGLTKAERMQFNTDIAEIRRQGYYEMPSTYAQGIIDIAIPIGNNDTGIIACLTVPRLLTVQANTHISNDSILSALWHCKARIEENLGLDEENNPVRVGRRSEE